MICGYPFIYNGIASELYECSMVYINESYTNRPSGSGVEFYTTSVRRNAEVLFLDARQSPPLEFGIEIVFDEPVDIYVLSRVKDWLGGQLGFKKLQVCIDNFSTFYYMCYIELNEDLIYAGGYRGISATVHCNAPFAFENEREKKYILDPDGTTDIRFNNVSEDSELLRPVIEFQMVRNGSFYITNNDTGKTTRFDNLQQEEILTLDNKNGIILSDTTILRVNNFNKVFLKLIKDVNHLTVGPNASYLTFRWINARRIGGGFYDVMGF